MSTRIKKIEKASLICGIILTFLFGLSLYIRVAIPYNNVFTDLFVRFGGYDPWYFMRLVENTLHHFPHHIQFDPFRIYHPPGAPMGLAPLFQQSLAFIIWVIGLGNPVSTLGQHGIEVIGAWYPAVLGALTVFPVYFIGKELYNRSAGLFSAALIAILPGPFLTRSLLGFTDHHAMETLFSTIAMLFFILAITSAREKEITFYSIRKKDWNSLRKPVIYSSLAGISFGAYFLAWRGAPLFIFILLIYALVQYVADHLRGKDTDYLCIVSMPVFIIPLAMIAPTLSFLFLPEFHVISLLLGIIVFAFLTALSFSMRRAKKIKPYWYPLAISAIGIISFLLLKVFDPSLYSTLTGALPRIFPSSKLSLTIAEVQPMGWNDIWNWFTTTFFLAFAALAWIGYNISRKWRSEEILIVVWSVVIFFTCFGQSRFAAYYAVNVAILCGFLSWKIIEFVAFRREEKGEEEIEKSGEKFLRADIIFTFIVILFVVFYPPLNESIATATLGSGGPRDDWYETLSWMKENTPNTGVDYYALYPEDYTYPESAYSVMSWWDYGYWITYIAHRIPVANPGQQGIGGACVFFVARNETEANNVADALNVRYVVSAFPMVDAMASYRNLYWSMTVWANDTAGHYTVDRNEGITVFELGETYFNTMETRLHMFDGNEVQFKGGSLGESSILLVMPFHTKPLQHYRLVYESPTYMIPHVIMNATNLDMLRWECYTGVGYTGAEKLVDELHYGLPDPDTPNRVRWTPPFVSPVSFVKVFEYVKGARIKGIAPNGSIIWIATDITTTQGRELMYSQIAISNGSYEFVVPYSTGGPIEGGTNYDVLATPYTIRAGHMENETIVWGTEKEVEIREGEVMESGTVLVDL